MRAPKRAMAPAPPAALCVLLLLSLLVVPSSSEASSQECLCCEPYKDVRYHLSTSTRYHDALEASGGPQEIHELPLRGTNSNGTCQPFFMFFVSRHGTREPTQKRVRQINNFASRLHELAHEGQTSGTIKDPCAENALRWMSEFKSPWEGYQSGGQLTEEGERELFGVGQRLRERFPGLFRRPYHSQAHPIFSTQVARSAASAVAFGLGMFEGQGPLGASKSRAFAVISETATTDTKLRFHDLCPGYTTAVDASQPHLDGLWGRVYGAIAADLANWTGAPFEAADVDSLWLVCRQQDAVAPEGFSSDSDVSDPLDSGNEGPLEDAPRDSSRGRSKPRAEDSPAGSDVEGSTSEGSEDRGPWGPLSACNMFAPEHVAALEWVDDANTFMQKGYGRLVNFRMAVPLFESMASALTAAVAARTKGQRGDSRKSGVTNQGEAAEGEGPQGDKAGETQPNQTKKKDKKMKKKKKGGVRELAQLHFAHAETVIPLACLLGLFQEPSPSADSDPQAASPSEPQSQGTGATGGELSRSSRHPGRDREGDEAVQRCAMGPKSTCGAPHATADTGRIFSALEGVRASLAAYHGSSPGLPLPLVPIPRPPPGRRAWMGRDVAPYAANIGVTLVDCGEGDPERFRVLILHNERAVVLPDCGAALCPLSKFMSNVVEAHLRHSFDATCRVPPEGARDGIVTRLRKWLLRFLEKLTSALAKNEEL